MPAPPVTRYLKMMMVLACRLRDVSATAEMSYLLSKAKGFARHFNEALGVKLLRHL